MKQVLVIIDMQTEMLSIPSLAIAGAVINEACAARNHGHPIVLLEMSGFGPTISGIRNMLADYEPGIVVPKDSTDGSVPLIEACEQKGFKLDFRICGVYSDRCVYDTVSGLSSRLAYPKMAVVKSACSPRMTEFVQARFLALPGVSLV